MPSVTANQSHAEANQSTGTSPPTWENRVRAWCWWCSSVGELMRTARGLEELATAMNVIRERKGQDVALEIARCL